MNYITGLHSSEARKIFRHNRHYWIYYRILKNKIQIMSVKHLFPRVANAFDIQSELGMFTMITYTSARRHNRTDHRDRRISAPRTASNAFNPP